MADNNAGTTGIIVRLLSDRTIVTSRYAAVASTGYDAFREAMGDLSRDASNYRLGRKRPIAYLVWEIEHDASGQIAGHMRCRVGAKPRWTKLYAAINQEIDAIEKAGVEEIEALERTINTENSEVCHHGR